MAFNGGRTAPRPPLTLPLLPLPLIPQIKLGLVIDLTKTDRYYKKAELKEVYSCGHLKLACEGHGEAPNDDIVSTFVSFCEKYFEANPDKSIGNGGALIDGIVSAFSLNF